MMTTDFKRLAIEIIDKSATGASWYNLEVAFSRLGHGGDVNSLKLAEELIKEGLLMTKPGENSALPIYLVTDAGRKYLNT
jgi:hypothetical protein